MKHFIYGAFFSMIAFSSCTTQFKKGDAGLEYKIISDGNGKKLAYGNFMQLQITQRYKGAKLDTLLEDSRDYLPRTAACDSTSTPAAYLKILMTARNGDSLVFRILTDSVFKQSPTEMPPFMKKGEYLYTTLKILNIFDTKAKADSANTAEMKVARPKIFKTQSEKILKEIEKNKAQLESDSKLISAYLEKNNIKAIKGNWGTFIDIHTEGTGNKIDNSSVATVNYTGRTLDSMKVFDSNTDPAFSHMQPFQVSVGQLGGVIFGWTDALMQMKKGTKATVYIPSSLGYGKNGNAPKIAPNANLVFDIEVLNVESEDELMAKNAEKTRAEEQMRQHAMDSIQHAAKPQK